MTSGHLASRYFLALGLFDSLNCFSELEAKISALPSNKKRGDAFEIFAEAYFATQKIAQAEQVWPFEAVPLAQRQALSLDTGRDMGVDGTYLTVDGELRAYQVKFRSNRPSLTWDELSTFMGLTDQVSQRVLFTNCETLPSLMQDRSGFVPIRGSDLDRLTAEDFEAMRQWLQNGRVILPRKHPLPHQQEALTTIARGLGENDRATVVMACGTGKSLVALWAAEQQDFKTILVLVPSLALVRQLLHEWLRETAWTRLTFVCVCSDPSVAKGADDLIVHQADLDFPVTTQSADVSRFLSKPFDGVKIVFSTYQSAQVVADGLPVGVDGMAQPFDLAIFDEAHKTASREGTRFSFALEDVNLPIRKRLFFTATPRHYDIRKKDKEGDNTLVYSMDRPEIYGPVIHTLSFAEAARRGIICDYKVVISVVTSEMVNDDLLKHGEVLVAGDTVKARQVALQIALQKAVEKYGVSRIFTFHGSVAAARSFTSSDSEGIQQHLPDFATLHVSGEMPTSRREDQMKAFRQAQKAVISNARCLTEGVDVPAVDMVAFISPRKSKVDIVQATGRAMRTSQGKEHGYVMLPLFLDMTVNETIEEALHRTDFSDVWDVLSAMKEQDDVLTDIIRQMREEKGRTGGYDESRLRARVEVLGPGVSLELIRNSIATHCIERLGVTWDERYGELKKFKERFGHSNVPGGWNENRQLATWVVTQRQFTKLGKTSEDRIGWLNQIGLAWDPLDANWEEMFSKLRKFKAINGHCNVLVYQSDNRELGQWIGRHRKDRKKGKVTEEHLRRLDEIGFVWDPLEASWEEMFRDLLEYKAKHGDCDIPKVWPENQPLATWLGSQRQSRKKGILSEERMARLMGVGLSWHTKNSEWDRMFEELTEYQKLHGDCRVPQQCAEYPGLGTWVDSQRQERKQERLNQARLEQLDGLGFEWDMRASGWEDMFSELVQYKNMYGNCDIPFDWSENKKLGSWVVTQRTSRQGKRKNSLNDDKVNRLDRLGFNWDPRDSVWEEMFVVLVAYKAEHSDCQVPKVWPTNQKLSGWVFTQRRAKKAEILSEEKISRLNEIGFVWDTLEAFWEEMFVALIAFKETHGHCNVPRGWNQNPQLSRWINRHRNEKMQGTLPEEKIYRLESIGFIWNTREAHHQHDDAS